VDPGADAAGHDFSAGAGGWAGEGGESLLGGAGVPFVRITGFDHEAAVRGAGDDDLRIFGVLGGVFSGGSDDPVSAGKLIAKVNWRVELTHYSEFEVSFIIVMCSIANLRNQQIPPLRCARVGMTGYINHFKVGAKQHHLFMA
jgi:hypothetical protein